MKRFVKKIAAGAAAVVVALSSTMAFAETKEPPNITTKDYSITLNNKIKYTTTAFGHVYDKQYDYAIIESTSVSTVPEDNVVSTIYVGAQVARYETGANYGSKMEEELKNTNRVQISWAIDHAAPIGKFTVFGAHTAFVNGTGGGKVAEIYTKTFSFTEWANA